MAIVEENINHTLPNDSSHKLQLYLPNKNTDTIISKFLDIVYNRNQFQKNILHLKNSTDKDKKKALIIEKTATNLRVFGESNNLLFIARDIGILMGYSNIKLQLKYYTNNEKVIGLYQLNNGKISKMEYLTWKGVVRASMNSRSALGDLFREALYESLNAAGIDSFSKYVTIAVENNPELADRALSELDKNMEYYKKLYEQETLQRQLLQKNLEQETQQRLIAEDEKINAELNTIIKEYRINEMSKYVERCEQALIDAYEWPLSKETELNILRQRACKPLYIYAPSSKIYKEWCGMKNDEMIEFTQYIPEYSYRIDYIVSRSNKNEESRLNIIKCILQETDFCYLMLHLGPMPKTKSQDDYIHIATEWVLDKKHYDLIIDELNKECEKISIKKKIVYYSSMDELRTIIHQKMQESIETPKL
jgi:hypothetical protein